MRKIQTQDVFKMARILKAVDVREPIKRYIREGREKARELKDAQKDMTEDEKSRAQEKIKGAQEEMGVDIFMDIICACADEKLENQLYDMLGGIIEIKPEEVKTLELEPMAENIKEIVKQNNMVNFFKAAGRLISE